MRFREALTNQQSLKTNRERDDRRRQSKYSEPAASSWLVWDAQLEVRVIQCFPNSDPLCWVKGQQLAYKVQEVLVDDVRGRDNFLSKKCGNVYEVRSQCTLTVNGRHARTSFLLCLDALGFGQSSRGPSLKYSGFERAPWRPKRSAIRPMTISIIARWSRLS